MIISPPQTTFLLRVNGVQPAYGPEFGFDSPRANAGRRDPYRQANASYSLLQWRDGACVRHTLLDIGMGVMPSLLELEASHGVHVVDEVVISHAHLDHFAGLDWLCGAIRRNERAEQPRPLPVYCSKSCWKTGPGRMFGYLVDKHRVEHRRIRAGVPLVLGELRLTPFRVIHDKTAPGARGFVAEHGKHKVILPCDFLDIPTVDDPIFHDADVCFLDATNWHPAPHTGHQSVIDAIALVRRWLPGRSYLTHYSGFHDLKHAGERVDRPLDPESFAKEIDHIRGQFDIRAAQHGMILGEDVEWPEKNLSK